MANSGSFTSGATHPGKYRKGQPSSNPGGRPKVIREVLEHAKDNVYKTMGLLLQIAMDGKQKTSDRISAIKEYHDRALGKPHQSVEHSGSIGMTHEEAVAALESLDDDPDGQGA